MGPGTFKSPASIKPFIDPDKGLEQFFDMDGPGPTQVDRDNWDAATKSKTDIGRGGFPAIEKKIKNKQDERSSIKGVVSKFFTDLTSTLKSTLFIIIVIALGVSFAFFYLKTIAGRAK